MNECSRLSSTRGGSTYYRGLGLIGVASDLSCSIKSLHCSQGSNEQHREGPALLQDMATSLERDVFAARTEQLVHARLRLKGTQTRA